MIYKSYQLEKNLANLQKKCVLFFGENLGLKDDFKKNIKNTNKGFKTLNFSQEEILKNKEIFFTEFKNISLFEEKKIYFVNDVSDKFLETIQDLERDLIDQSVFLFSGILDKKSKIRNYFEKSKDYLAVPCYADNEISIKNIIIGRLKGYKNLTPNIINVIINKTNLDRNKLHNELDKIMMLFQDKKIDTNKLEIFLDDSINEDFNLLKDQALLGNKTKTNKLLSETVILDEKNIFYLNLINQRLAKLKELNELSNGRNIEATIDNLKPPIFWKDKPNFLRQAQVWNEKKIHNLQKQTYQLEIKIKSNSTINKNLMMKKLIVDICQIANS